MNILGISAFYHDSAACLVRDGEIVAAAQAERFTRKKHDERFPKLAVEYCLAEAGLAPSLPIWLKQKLHTPREIGQWFGGSYKGRERTRSGGSRRS
jgi:hypothetical protein